MASVASQFAEPARRYVVDSLAIDVSTASY